jgi:hypothetical protein
LADIGHMRKLTVAIALVGALIVALPGVALASSPATMPPAADLSTGVGLPIKAPPSATKPPPGFSSTARQAVKAAEVNRTMLALHAREHPLSFQVWVWDGDQWFVDFAYLGKRVAEVVVSPAGRVMSVWTGPLATAVYARGDFATLFGSPWVLVPFSVLFLIPFLDLRRRRRMLHLDAFMLLSFLVSYLLFDHAKLVAAVWLVYPPLIYLLARMLWIGGMRIRGRSARVDRAAVRLAPLLSMRVLWAGLIALVLARVGLSLFSRVVADVGYASVIGAHRIAHGQSLYFASTAHSDTYGPIAYLAYVPFEQLFPWRGTWDYLASAHAASIFFDLVTIVGLVLLGRRLRGGREGLRLGLVLGWAWAACPFTLLALMMHTNDGLIAMLSVLSLLAFASPAARGALLGLAAAAKFASAALLPLFAARADRRLRDSIVCVAAFAVVVLTAIGLYLPSGGLTEFYHHTIGYQLNRSDVFSAWALHPALDPVKAAIEAGAVILCGIVAFRPRERSISHVCALAAAITIAVQLPAVHWFYYFIVWFIPFALVALLARAPQQAPANADTNSPSTGLPATPTPVLELVPAGA